MTRLLVTVFVTSMLLVGCHSTSSVTSNRPADHPDVRRVAAMLTGNYDSRDQAAEAPDDYFEIRLVTIPIWTTRDDGAWLYVEQAAFSALERPYRQRVYHVHHDAVGQLRSDVYELPGDPLSFAGAWRSETDLFADLQPDDLSLRDGCSILLGRSADAYLGATDGTGCSSSLGGAAYATSEVELRSDLIVSWDRGWDANGEQAWGATAGGYRFVRRSEAPPE